jgi:hypothetical protein
MIILTVLFVVFFVLYCIALFAPAPAPWGERRHILLAICVGILGWVVFEKLYGR